MNLWTLLLLASLTAANFLVQISPNLSLDAFFDKYPSVYKEVSKTYSFGSFLGISGNFNLKTIELFKNLTEEVG